MGVSQSVFYFPKSVIISFKLQPIQYSCYNHFSVKLLPYTYMRAKRDFRLPFCRFCGLCYSSLILCLPFIFRYKILFLDVLFPLDVEKIIFVDADQVKTLWIIEIFIDIIDLYYNFTICRKTEIFHYFLQLLIMNFSRAFSSA